MNLVDLQTEAARLFPLAAAQAVDHPREKNPPLETLRDLCWRNFEALGYD